MSVHVQCPCGKILDVPDSYVGKRIKCPGCRAALEIPKPYAPMDAEQETEKPISPIKPQPSAVASEFDNQWAWRYRRPGPKSIEETATRILEEAEKIRFRLGCLVWMGAIFLLGLYFASIAVNGPR